MQNNREGRRTTAQFLNGVAVATLAAGAVGPLMSGSAVSTNVVVAIIAAVALHGLALVVSRRP